MLKDDIKSAILAALPVDPRGLGAHPCQKEILEAALTILLRDGYGDTPGEILADFREICRSAAGLA